ncbi:MAG TPA: circadian clock KaiB family protein [Steroidobacteraceae bacterium]|jgi:circadian clock protein KaiB
MATAKKNSRLGPVARRLEAAIAGNAKDRFVLRLYVSGLSARSRQAIENIRRLCEEHLAGRYELQIIDIYQQPELAKDQQLIAAPTLVKKLPLPLRKVVGDMHDSSRLLIMLGITVQAKE